MEKVDIIIPVYKPNTSFLTLLHMLEQQSYPVNQIIIINTEQKYWDRMLYGKPLVQSKIKLKLYHIAKMEFDHGLTRNFGIQKSDADYIVMMTQDAMPADQNLIENLIKPLMEDEEIAVAYARQLPGENAGPVERYTRGFNYPDKNSIKRKEDKEKLGIKTYFCSNVCAAYNPKIYQKTGGFIHEAIFNEDMIYAAKCIEKGYGIAYVADARVIHSHNYKNIVQFHRNFDLGVSQADHPEVFQTMKSESEGLKLVKQTAVFLKKNGYWKLILPMYITSVYKWLGYKMGKNYKKLSRKQILCCTMNKEYWKRRWS